MKLSELKELIARCSPKKGIIGKLLNADSDFIKYLRPFVEGKPPTADDNNIDFNDDFLAFFPEPLKTKVWMSFLETKKKYPLTFSVFSQWVHEKALPIYKLPDELLLGIFSFLNQSALNNASQVCNRFRRISLDSSLKTPPRLQLDHSENPEFTTVPLKDFIFVPFEKNQAIDFKPFENRKKEKVSFAFSIMQKSKYLVIRSILMLGDFWGTYIFLIPIESILNADAHLSTKIQWKRFAGMNVDYVDTIELRPNRLGIIFITAYSFEFYIWDLEKKKVHDIFSRILSITDTENIQSRTSSLLLKAGNKLALLAEKKEIVDNSSSPPAIHEYNWELYKQMRQHNNLLNVVIHDEILIWDDVYNITPSNYRVIKLQLKRPIIRAQLTSDEKIILYTRETVTNQDDALRVTIYSIAETKAEKEKENQPLISSFIIPPTQSHNPNSKDGDYILLPHNQLAHYYEGKVELWDFNACTSKALPKISTALAASIENGDSIKDSYMILLQNSIVAIYTTSMIHICDLTKDECLQKIKQSNTSYSKCVESFCLESKNLLQINQIKQPKEDTKYTLSLIQFPLFKAKNNLTNATDTSTNIRPPLSVRPYEVIEDYDRSLTP